MMAMIETPRAPKWISLSDLVNVLATFFRFSSWLLFFNLTLTGTHFFFAWCNVRGGCAR
jgi:hypothetical protein